MIEEKNNKESKTGACLYRDEEWRICGWKQKRENPEAREEQL